MAPRIAKGKVIIGVSGGDRPTRGFFDAYDAATGRRVLALLHRSGRSVQAVRERRAEESRRTWDREWWKLGGGGAVWDGMAYDPEAELVYVGTGNAGAVDVASTVVEGQGQSLRRLDPRRPRRHRRVEVALPGGAGRQLGLRQRAAPDARGPGDQRTPRKVIMQANKNAFFYVIDRLTGQFISAQPFSQVTWAKGSIQKTGRPIVNP